ncbi:MAG: acylphosphatase [Rhizobacter sp.]|nr:acylphosphatase [Rhizobacter sp.]
MIRVCGRVQGVGFRARARGLALRHGLRGWVANVGRGVTMHACGPAERLEAFVLALTGQIGPPARIERIERDPAPRLPPGCGFVIAPTDTPLAPRGRGRHPSP